jgi:hypothetical protein
MSAPGVERRAHKRFESTGPVTMVDPSGKRIAGARLANVSDGGVFVTTPIDSLPVFGCELEVSFRIPRSTANTYMLEAVRATGKVSRQQPMRDGDNVGVAIRFAEPLELMIEC